MLAGFPPFQIATTQDWWFRACLKGQYQAFWDAHKRSTTFPDGAMSLLNRIFVVDPNQRASLQDIATDPWFNSPGIPTATLTADLHRRHLEVEREKRAEKEKEVQARYAKEQAAAAQSADQEFDPFGQDTFRSIFIEPASVFAPALGALEQKVAVYTSFWSMAGADVILQRLQVALAAPALLSGEATGAETACKATFTVDEKKFKIKASVATPTGKLALTLQVYTHTGAGGEKKQQVRVLRRSGSTMTFHDAFNCISEAMADISCPADLPAEAGAAAAADVAVEATAVAAAEAEEGPAAGAPAEELEKQFESSVRLI